MPRRVHPVNVVIRFVVGLTMAVTAIILLLVLTAFLSWFFAAAG
jgi:hypothetical protein